MVDAKGFSGIFVQLAAKVFPQADDQTDSMKLSFKTISTIDIRSLN